MFVKVLPMFLMIFTFSTSPIFAQEEQPSPDFVIRLEEGLKQIFRSPKELIKTPAQSIKNSENKPMGLLGGVLKAPFQFLKELGHGAVETVTFPVENETLPTPIESITNEIGAGIKQIAQSPMSLIEEPQENIRETDSTGRGLLQGLLKFPFRFAEELGHGVVNVLTFPAD